MKRRRDMQRLRGMMFALVLTGLVIVAGPVSAAPKTGCPAGTWEELTVEAAAAIVWPILSDQTPWVDQQDFQESAVRPYDRNGEGSICLKVIDDYAPNSHWFGTSLVLPRDNNANA